MIKVCLRMASLRRALSTSQFVKNIAVVVAERVEQIIPNYAVPVFTK